MEWNIHYDICAIFIFVIIISLFMGNKNYPSKANKIYILLVMISLLAAVFDVLSVCMIHFSTGLPMWVNKLVNTLYFLSFNAVPFVYLMYVLCTYGRYSLLRKRTRLQSESLQR